jgi:uncharacterized NAD(P)/FAD-binding protein YdhS
MVFSPSSTPTIAIVGAGLSGSLVAAHLLKTAQRPLAIKLVERRAEVGQGVAYSTSPPTGMCTATGLPQRLTR